MGCKDRKLPKPLTKLNSVNCQTFPKITKKTYNDNLCLLRALVLHLQGKEGLEEEPSKEVYLYLEKIGRTVPAGFQNFWMNQFPSVRDLVQENIFLHDIDFVDGVTIGELARRSVGKKSNTVRLILYNIHIYCVSEIKSLIKTYRCPSCISFSSTKNQIWSVF